MSARPGDGWCRLGERAWRAPLPDGVEPAALLASLRAAPGVEDAVVTDGYAAVYGVLAAPPPLVAAPGAAAPRTHVVRVLYDGPDLAEVAARAGLDVAALAAAHGAARYRVRFLGFLPGFAYLDGLDERLVVPRRATPRPRVAAGTVGIAGRYSAIYPLTSPGGWNLIGHAVDFVAWSGERPTLAAGDLVRFTPA